MVYSSEILDSVNILGPAGDSANVRDVMVYFNGTGIHTITGPSPTVALSTTVERNEAGEAMSNNHRITLTGKIFKGTGIGSVTSGINGLNKLFSNNRCGRFTISCKGQELTPVFEAVGVRVASLEYEPSNDNWVYSAGYSIGLEYYTPAITGWYVKSFSDNWNIEPLEDYTFTDGFKDLILCKNEVLNPKRMPGPGVPDAAAGSPNGANSTTSHSLAFRSIPQFKISRTISAIGIPSGTGFCSPPPVTKLAANMYPEISVLGFENAKKWVEERAASAFGAGYVAGTTDPWSPTTPVPKSYFYNHLRSVNFDIMNSKYELTDTWLAMPTGISYVEDYTIEVSTDEKYLTTVSVKGEIKGLSMSSRNITGVPYVSGSGNPLAINLSLSTGTLVAEPAFSPGPTILDVKQLTASIHTKFLKNKYDNAMSGWLNDIKPYIYRRASMGINSKERQLNYIPPITNPPLPPNNPVYCKQPPLNVIPVATSESHNPKKGTISYSYEFTSKFSIISGALFESISIQDTGPTDVIAEAFVLGRTLGPVLQNLGSKTSSKKSVTIEIGIVPPTSMPGFFMHNNTCPLYISGSVYKTITGIIEGLKPFGDRSQDIFGSAWTRTNAPGQVYVTSDTQSWDPASGRFTKSVSWVYQHCNNNKNYLDH